MLRFGSQEVRDENADVQQKSQETKDQATPKHIRPPKDAALTHTLGERSAIRKLFGQTDLQTPTRLQEPFEASARSILSASTKRRKLFVFEDPKVEAKSSDTPLDAPIEFAPPSTTEREYDPGFDFDLKAIIGKDSTSRPSRLIPRSPSPSSPPPLKDASPPSSPSTGPTMGEGSSSETIHTASDMDTLLFSPLSITPPPPPPPHTPIPATTRPRIIRLSKGLSRIPVLSRRAVSTAPIAPIPSARSISHRPIRPSRLRPISSRLSPIRSPRAPPASRIPAPTSRVPTSRIPIPTSRIPIPTSRSKPQGLTNARRRSSSSSIPRPSK